MELRKGAKVYPLYIHLELLMLRRKLICAHTCFSDVYLFLTTQKTLKTHKFMTWEN